MRHWLPSHAGNRAGRAGTVTKRRARDRRFAALALVAALMGSGVASVLSQQANNRANALTTGDTVDLRVLLIGASGGATDPTTAAWAAGLDQLKVSRTRRSTERARSVRRRSRCPRSLESSATHGLYNGVVFAGKPGDFAAGQFTNLFAYESAFGIRQLDGNFVPPSGGTLGLIAPTVADPSTGAGISTTTPIPALTAAGLADVPGVGRSGADRHRHVRRPDAVLCTVPTGATETPMLERRGRQRADRRVPAPDRRGSTPQAGVDEMTINFNYNQYMTQWLLLGPGLIDWVTGATHLGLYRNYSTLHVDDVFTADDTWDTTTHANDYDPADALRMRPVDVDSDGGVGEGQQLPPRHALQRRELVDQRDDRAAADPLLAEFQKNDPAHRQAVHAGLRVAQPHLGPRLPRRRLRHDRTTSKPKCSRTRTGPPPRRAAPRAPVVSVSRRPPTTRSRSGRRTRPRSCPAATPASPTSRPATPTRSTRPNLDDEAVGVRRDRSRPGATVRAHRPVQRRATRPSIDQSSASVTTADHRDCRPDSHALRGGRVSRRELPRVPRGRPGRTTGPSSGTSRRRRSATPPAHGHGRPDRRLDHQHHRRRHAACRRTSTTARPAPR